jgi:Methylase involved in ubiquinone/menaquinone biosynthesis
MLLPEVMDYYRRGGERRRLSAGAGRLEYLRTLDVLDRVLPPVPASILDVGGATGVYAEPLAAMGYRVHLVDPVPEHVLEASGRPGVTAEPGDVRDLPVPDASVDAVLLLGPLYHLTARSDRVRAWREAARVLRPGGIVVAATISRFASLFDGFVKGYVDDPRFRVIVANALADGVHHNSGAEPGWFTTAYFHRPEEPSGEASEAGLTFERVVMVESPLWMTGPHLNQILDNPDTTEALLTMLRRIEDEPSVVGASSHLLTVARLP